MSLLSQKEPQEVNFSNLLELEFRNGLLQSESLKKNKEKAWERFSTLGLPTRKTGSYQYIWLRSLFEKAYKTAKSATLDSNDFIKHIYPECRQSYLVFVNGFFQPNLSVTSALPKQVAILPLSEAVKTYGAFLNNHWSKSQKEETDSFAALNAALHSDGLFFYLPPKIVVEAPIQLIFISDTAQNPLMIHPRVQIFAGANSSASFVSKQVYSNSKSYCINQLTDFALEENAHLKFSQVAHGGSTDGWHFDATRATLKRNSSFNSVYSTDGIGLVRHDYRVALIGENAEANLNGIWNLSNDNQAHTNVLIDHQASHCRSLQLFKGILDDQSRSSFEGKIFVQQIAQKTDAFQLNNNLLLSDRAHADSKPNLEVYADDVKASHGATMGQLDTEQLFYMQTRGFSKSIAKRMLIKSFAKEVTDRIDVDSVRSELEV